MNGPPRRVIAFGVLETLTDLRGMLDASLRDEAGIDGVAQRARLVAMREAAERELVDALDEYRPYREIFAESLAMAARRAGSPIGSGAIARMTDRLGALPVHPDAATALPSLARLADIALVSSLDPDDLAAFADRLAPTPAHTVGAAVVGAYPPEPDLLLALLHEMELDEEELLFVSARCEDELFTAHDLGIDAAFVDRSGRGVPEDLEVRWHVPSLDGLFRRLSGRRRRRRAPRR